MIWESKYRRQALQSWDRAHEETKKELNATFTAALGKSRNPIVVLFASLAAWVTQQ
ncbi:MAG TPA: hypothetical protein VE710_16575 [Candidatus Bathyarchaeia archaeon]|nr:hypothetical protein [Candidatus Bathyarchaeia archaeon]